MQHQPQLKNLVKTRYRPCPHGSLLSTFLNCFDKGFYNLVGYLYRFVSWVVEAIFATAPGGDGGYGYLEVGLFPEGVYGLEDRVLYEGCAIGVSE